jgi:GTPase SAR1 family protein
MHDESQKFRIAWVGDSGVGKTSLCDRLQHKEHGPTNSTVGLDSFLLEEYISGVGHAKILFMDTCKAKSLSFVIHY